MKTREELIELFDVYESLFTSKQKGIFKMYYFEDLTQDEIADQLKITKSAVGDSLTKTKQSLVQYEIDIKALKFKKESKNATKQ